MPGPFRSSGRGARVCVSQEVDDETAPRFHRVEDGLHVGRRREGAVQLVGLAYRDRAPGCLGDAHDPEVDRSDVRRVVVEEPDRTELRHEVRDELLGPLANEPACHPAVERVHVAPDPDRPKVVETRVAPGSRPAHKERPVTVAEDHVRDQLLPGGVALHLRSRSELPCALDRGEPFDDVVRHDAVPRDRPGRDATRHDEDELVRHGSAPTSDVAEERASGSTAVRVTAGLAAGSPVGASKARA